jgi:hypothetical protein
MIKFVSVRLVVFSGYSETSTNKTDRHDKTDILLKVALNTIALTLKHKCTLSITVLAPFPTSSTHAMGENSLKVTKNTK